MEIFFIGCPYMFALSRLKKIVATTIHKSMNLKNFKTAFIGPSGCLNIFIWFLLVLLWFYERVIKGHLSFHTLIKTIVSLVIFFHYDIRIYIRKAYFFYRRQLNEAVLWMRLFLMLQREWYNKVFPSPVLLQHKVCISTEDIPFHTLYLACKSP